jgi:hypothetical protein
MNRNERDFLRVVKYGSALGLAGTAAFVASIRQLNPVARFELDWIVAVAFIVTGVAVIAGWKLVFGDGREDAPAPRGRRFALAALLLGVATVASFAWSLKDLSPEKRNQVATGSLIGLAAVSVVGIIVWRLVCFLEADHQRGLDEERERKERH